MNNEEMIIVECRGCGKLYQASEIECRTVYWRGEILIESYCPFCGCINQEKTGFKSSKGGKF